MCLVTGGPFPGLSRALRALKLPVLLGLEVLYVTMAIHPSESWIKVIFVSMISNFNL